MLDGHDLEFDFDTLGDLSDEELLGALAALHEPLTIHPTFLHAPLPTTHPASALSLSNIALTPPAPTPSPVLKAAASTALTPPASTPSKAATTVLTPPKPAGPSVADLAKQQIATQKLQSSASTATSKAQKVLALAAKISSKRPKMKAAITNAANKHVKKASTAAPKSLPRSKMGAGTYRIGSFEINIGVMQSGTSKYGGGLSGGGGGGGLAPSSGGGTTAPTATPQGSFNINQAFDGAAAEAAINAMIAQGSEDDALATLTVDFNDCASYVDQLTAINAADLVTSGTALLQSMQDLATAYDNAGDSDSSLPPKVASLDQKYNTWLNGPNFSGGPGSAAYALNQAMASGTLTPPAGAPNAAPGGGSTATTPPAGTATSGIVLTKAMGATDGVAYLNSVAGIGPGAVIQIDGEQMLVSGAYGMTAQVQRGYSQQAAQMQQQMQYGQQMPGQYGMPQYPMQGAPAAPASAHAAGAVVTVLPPMMSPYGQQPYPGATGPSGGGGGGGGDYGGGGGDYGDDGGGGDPGYEDDGGDPGSAPDDGGGMSAIEMLAQQQGGGDDGGYDDSASADDGSGGGYDDEGNYDDGSGYDDVSPVRTSALEDAVNLTSGDLDFDADAADGGDTEAGALTLGPRGRNVAVGGFDYFGHEEFDLVGHGGGGHGGGHGGHGHGGRGRRGGFGLWGPWGYGDDLDGFDVLDVVDVDADEITVDDVVNAVTARLKERQQDGTLVGAYDIAQSQRQMNTLKQVTVGIARALVKHGLQVADSTISTAEGGIFQSSLPGITTLKTTRSHVQWHSDKLASMKDPTALYDSGDDLKKWVMQSFIDSNAVDEGRGEQEQIWSDMWTEIGENLASLPAKIANTVMEIPGKIVKGVTGIPLWGWIVGGVGIVVLLGVGVYKIIMKHGGTVASVAARRYLP